ncbi:hypothetical protein BOTBODRAFT_169079 [Botryobasidium botryosum FD-172 SS1]|uniref:HNH nuclease domain-containing protein n=1 Tax=Botryobasidium botryosum (strain FD-172 SS1) TaxID=930990 RepID=A0A067N237_BOTB1|nr:hypothetical protein BOTBODRAFT_169079 [Botryobasidium botryosum FD-172 SS1]
MAVIDHPMQVLEYAPSATIQQNPQAVHFYHPGHAYRMLTLYAQDPIEGGTFGVYHEIALHACQILAQNKPGFFSTSINREDPRFEERHLTGSKYYFHLDEHTPYYRLSYKFADWLFPHNKMPESWQTFTPTPAIREITATALSSMIKGRAHAAASRDGEKQSRQHTSYQRHLIPGPAADVHMDSGNLVAMQHAVYFLFDAAHFTIVPKDGKMVVYFLKAPREASALYHNRIFDTTDLSVEYLYARFAWTVIKVASERVSDAMQALLEGGDGGGSSGRGGGNGGGQSRPPGSDGPRTPKKRPRVSDETAVDEGCYAYEKRDQELAQHFPFFLTDASEATPWQYEHLMWYPGKYRTDRLKKVYFDSHPNVRARSEPGTRVVLDGDVLEPTGSGVLSEEGGGDE